MSGLFKPGRRAGRRHAVPAGIAVRVVMRALACVGLFLVTGALPAVAQAPDETYLTLETEHFRVTFPEHLEALGRRAADRAERAWVELSEHFIDPPGGTIDLLVTDHADVSNGFAGVTPSNRITIFARPPVDALALGFADEWLELVITHELVHIVHLDHVTNPIGRLGRAVMGRVPSEWPYFPQLGTPGWVIEGIATWYESRLTKAGRTRGSYHDMQLRTATLEGRFETIDQASSESPVWPAGNRSYLYGSLFFDHLLDTYGEERMAAFVDAIAGQWIPYRIDAAGKDAFGVSMSEAWDDWRASVESELAGLDDELSAYGPISQPEALTSESRWALYPAVSPDGRWLAYTRSDGHSDMQVRVVDLQSGASRQVGRSNQLATFAWIDARRLLVSQLELSGPFRAYDDLYVFDVEGGSTRLTEGARLGQPSVAPNGGWAVAVREGGGTNELVRVDLGDGSVTTIVAPDPDVHWAFPAVSPDGRWIAATRFEPDARHDVVVLDARTGALVTQVTDDRALDLFPRWSPDGGWLVWTSDRTGIFNVHGAPVLPSDGSAGRRIMLTNVRTGAAYPSIDPSGRWLYFSGYHADGWEIERVPFEPGRRVVDLPLASRFESDGPPTPRGEVEGETTAYMPGLTMRPSYWELSYADAVETPSVVVVDGADTLALPARRLLGPAIGFQTSGSDLVGRHAYSLFLRATTTGRKIDGGFAYAYSGFGTPTLTLALSQNYEDAGQQVARPQAGAPLDTLYVLRRERFLEGALSFRYPTWRWNRTITLGGGVVWLNRDLLDSRLEPTSSYRLFRPANRLYDASLSVSLNSTRSHSFQMGTSEGISLFLQGRMRREAVIPDSLRSVAGADRSTGELLGRAIGAIPLWRFGYGRQVIAFRASGGIATGPGADPGQYRVGGATGESEPITGQELFGGRFFFFPVRGYEPSSRFGRYAWTVSTELRFPLWMIHRGLGAWPLHFDRTMASVFFDVGNAWGPDVWPTGFQNPLRDPIASVGAELTAETLAFFDIQLRLRGGVAVPLVAAPGAAAGSPTVYVRFGLPY